MKITDIVNRVNAYLAGEQLSYSQLKPFLDDTVDDINQQLNSIYPVFSELDPSASEYTAFPDIYLRKVVSLGAAWYFYKADEEGVDSAPAYKEQYYQALYFMARDMMNNVPEQYKQGYVDPNTLAPGEVAPDAPVLGVIKIEPDGDLEEQGVSVNANSWSI